MWDLIVSVPDHCLSFLLNIEVCLDSDSLHTSQAALFRNDDF